MFNLWLNEDAMSKAMKSKCQIEAKVDGFFGFYDRTIKGSFLEIDAPNKLVLSFSVKVWHQTR